jgi:DNA-binding winged helix-turn-helix (wHTH) protein/predicted ATPase
MFGKFVLDPKLYQLRADHDVVALEPKVFDVLHYLVNHRDRLVTRQELMSALWPNEVVTEAVLHTSMTLLRKALGQKRGDRAPIETVHGRGYRFVETVTAQPDPSSTSHTRLRPIESLRASSLPPAEIASLQPEIPLSTIDPTFVGRGPQLDRILTCLRAAQRRQGQICVLIGEAGIGKTRLSTHVATIARALDAEVWSGVCPEGVGTPMLWIWQQLLRWALNSEGPEVLRQWLGTHRADVATWLPELIEEGDPRDATRGHEQATFRMLDAMRSVLSRASAARTRVLLLEDMHRADHASWHLLRLLAPQLEQWSVLVIATLRGRDDLTAFEPVQKHVGELARIPCCQVLYLRGFSESESATFLGPVLGHSLTEAQAGLLHSKSEGNPLFLRELGESLRDAQCAPLTLATLPGFEPPDVVRHVLRRRVSRLGEEAYRVLEAASVFSDAWEVKALSQVAGIAREQVLEAIDAAAQQKIVAPLPGVETYRFTHDLLRDTLRADLTTHAKKRFHLLAATACEESVQWRGREGVRELAHHLYHALPEGDAGRALQHLMHAGTLAEQAGDLQEAAQLYAMAQGAARCAGPLELERQAELEQALARLSAEAVS